MKSPPQQRDFWGITRLKPFHFIIGACLICLLLIAFFLSIGSGAAAEGNDGDPSPGLQPPLKPIYGWYICEDLGLGPVPGLTDIRYRVKLCHPDGWVVRAYCLRPLLENPPKGAECVRTGPLTYWCGDGVQPVKEYVTKQVPPTPTPTATPTPTSTPTPTPTARPNPGGPGFADLINQSKSVNSGAEFQTVAARETAFGMTSAPLSSYPASPTPTPFRPSYPTPTATPTRDLAAASPASHASVEPAAPSSTPAPDISQHDQPVRNFQGIDFTNSSQRITIVIKPDNKRVNRGRPISISFFPGEHCTVDDRTACVNSYLNDYGAETIFVTVHSGIGKEGQAFRHAVEGTGYDIAAQPLQQVRKNLDALSGASVTIRQGDVLITRLRLVTASRLPPGTVKSYLAQPVETALQSASRIDPEITARIDHQFPKIVFETCGWRMTGERWVSGLTSTSASIYLGVIQALP